MGFISQLITQQRIKIGCPENTPKLYLLEESTDSMLGTSTNGFPWNSNIPSYIQEDSGHQNRSRLKVNKKLDSKHNKPEKKNGNDSSRPEFF